VDGLMTLAGQQFADPIEVLTQKGPVQPQIGAQCRQRFRCGVDPQDDLGRVAGQDEQNREHRDGNEKQQQDQRD